MLEFDEKTPFGVIEIKTNMCIALRMIYNFERRRKYQEDMDTFAFIMLSRHKPYFLDDR